MRRRIKSITATLLLLTTLAVPQITEAQFGRIEVRYDLTPQSQNTPITNQATMRTNSETFTASACTEVGNVDSGRSCTSNAELVQAAQDFHNAIMECTKGFRDGLPPGVDVVGQKLSDPEVSSCLKRQLTPKYGADKTNKAVGRAAANAISVHCLQCVGQVEAALTLIGASDGTPEWETGSHFWNKPPRGYERVTTGSVKPGDVFTYGVYPAVGHVGIVKSIKSTHSFIAIEANAANKGGTNGQYGTCDISDDRVIDYKPGDISGHTPRFLRQIAAEGSEPDGNDYVSKIKTEFNTEMRGFDNRHLEWAYEKLKDITSKAGNRFITLAHGTNQSRPIIIEAKEYIPQNPYSTQEGCTAAPSDNPGVAVVDPGSSNIRLVQGFPGADSEDVFKVTLTHELAHMVQLCPMNADSKRTNHTSLFQRSGGLSFYSQNANQSGNIDGTPYTCPNGVSAANEDYTDMLTYHLNPGSAQKDVCGLGRRLPNPYSAGFTDHKNMAKQIVGDYK